MNELLEGVHCSMFSSEILCHYCVHDEAIYWQALVCFSLFLRPLPGILHMRGSHFELRPLFLRIDNWLERIQRQTFLYAPLCIWNCSKLSWRGERVDRNLKPKPSTSHMRTPAGSFARTRRVSFEVWRKRFRTATVANTNIRS